MRSLRHSLQSNCHFYALGVLLSLLTLNHVFYGILGVIYVFVLRKNKHILAIIAVMALTVFYQYVFTRVKINPTTHFVILYVDENRYTAYSNLRKYHIYTKEKLEVGDVVLIDNTISQYDYDQFEGDFNLNAYYKSKGIYGLVKYPKIEKVDHYDLPHKWLFELNVYIDGLPIHARDFVKSLVIGDYAFEEKQSIGRLGLSHLFVLSGLHVAMMIGILDKLLKPLSQKKKLWFYYIFLGTYLFITSMPVSLLRAISQFLIYETLKIKKLNFTRLDALSISFVFIFLFNPYMVYQLGFILSFIISLFFVLEAPDKGFFGLVKHTIFVQLLILPFISNFQAAFYPISFLISPIFMLLFTYVIMPLSWLSLAGPIALALNDGFMMIKQVIIWLEKGQIGIQLPIISGFFLVVYIAIWLYSYLGYINHKHFYKTIWLFCLIVAIPSFSLASMDSTVTFLDVGQGDSSLITTAHHDCVILVDAFGDVYEFLRAKQITRIDYLIITHGDLDHYREAEKVLSSVRVENIVTNPYEYGAFYDFIKHNYAYSKVKSGDTINCGILKLDILGPIRAYDDANNNSVVFKTVINKQSYLFTGDIEQAAEHDLAIKYKQALKSDILKVPHHGSSTSSSTLFLEYVNPKIAIVSSGRDNKFKHPHQSVIDRYKFLGIKVYQTKLDYTITITSSHLRRKYHISLHKQKLL